MLIRLRPIATGLLLPLVVLFSSGVGVHVHRCGRTGAVHVRLSCPTHGQGQGMDIAASGCCAQAQPCTGHCCTETHAVLQSVQHAPPSVDAPLVPVAPAGWVPVPNTYVWQANTPTASHWRRRPPLLSANAQHRAWLQRWLI